MADSQDEQPQSGVRKWLRQFRSASPDQRAYMLGERYHELRRTIGLDALANADLGEAANEALDRHLESNPEGLADRILGKDGPEGNERRPPEGPGYRSGLAKTSIRDHPELAASILLQRAIERGTAHVDGNSDGFAARLAAGTARRLNRASNALDATEAKIGQKIDNHCAEHPKGFVARAMGKAVDLTLGAHDLENRMLGAGMRAAERIRKIGMHPGDDGKGGDRGR